MIKNRKMRPARWFSILLLTAVLFVAGCSNTESEENPIAMIEEVLKLQLNGPDEKLLDLMWNEENQEVVDGVLKNPKFDKYVIDQYGEYFTVDGLDVFIRTGGTAYHNLADSDGYAMSLDKMVIDQSEHADNRYKFVASVNLEKEDGSEMAKEIEGIATISTAENKIGKFEYVSDDGLTIPLQ